jgi:hypothetical protein
MKEMGTLEDYLAECEFPIKGNRIIPQKKMVGFEKSMVTMG